MIKYQGLAEKNFQVLAFDSIWEQKPADLGTWKA